MKYSVTKTTSEHLGFFKKSGNPIIKEVIEVLYSGSNKEFAEALFHEHYLYARYLFDDQVKFIPKSSSFEMKSIGRFTYQYDLECIA
jgi:hypothetical protein